MGAYTWHSPFAHATVQTLNNIKQKSENFKNKKTLAEQGFQ
jgi:hypothetical protein